MHYHGISPIKRYRQMYSISLSQRLGDADQEGLIGSVDLYQSV